MKSLCVAAVAMCFSMVSYAQNVGNSYVNVVHVSCINSQGEFVVMDIAQQVLEAALSDNGQIRNLSLEPLRDEHPDAKVELSYDFYGSGYDVLAGVVMGDGTFGTVGLLLEKELNASKEQEMTVFFMEAMSGRQFSTQMDCVFQE